jgi:UDP:flavonoid glycosyltransferase YjiC (YdhE family)
MKSMKIGLVTKGSRGDIQPFIALAIGLKKHGHQVTIVTFKNFRKQISDYQIDFIPLDLDMENEVYNEDVMEVTRNGNLLKFALLLRKHSDKYLDKIIREIDLATKDFDFIVASGLAFPNILPITVKRKINYAILNFSMPYSITKEFPSIGFGFQNIPIINKLSYTIFSYASCLFFLLREVNLSARALNLPKWSLSQLRREFLLNNRLIIHPMSKQLLPQPKDWPSNSAVTGFLNIPSAERSIVLNEQISSELELWLQDGEKPVYIGFGSIPVPDTEIMYSIIKNLLYQTPHRVIYCRGWSRPFLDFNHKNLFQVDSINHEWLMPRCKLAIIHGGIGTVGAVLQGKIPMIIASILADQPNNGDLIEKKKLGIHIPFNKLSYEKVLKGIELLEQEEYQTNAQKVGENMRQENGVEESVACIEQYIMNMAAKN